MDPYLATNPSTVPCSLSYREFQLPLPSRRLIKSLMCFMSTEGTSTSTSTSAWHPEPTAACVENESQSTASASASTLSLSLSLSCDLAFAFAFFFALKAIFLSLSTCSAFALITMFDKVPSTLVSSMNIRPPLALTNIRSEGASARLNADEEMSSDAALPTVLA